MADNKLAVIFFTKSQIENLIDFFEFEFITMIQKCDDIDNMEYLCDMCTVYKNLKEEKDKTWGGEEK